MKIRALLLVSVAAVSLSGCAAPLIGSLTLSQLSTIAGGISTATTGKGLSDQVLSLITGKDCSITEGILRKDRNICEEPGSLATRDDFKGVFAWLDAQRHGSDTKDAGTPASGDAVLANYEKARGEELAKADEARLDDVTSASATALELRLSFADDDTGAGSELAASDAGMDTGNSQIAMASLPAIQPALAADDTHVTLLTFRDGDADGMPRIVTRYVYMMAPIPDADTTANAVPEPIERSAELAPVIPATKTALVETPAVTVRTAMLAPVEPMAIKASLLHPAVATVAVGGDPRPLVYWYLSAR